MTKFFVDASSSNGRQAHCEFVSFLAAYAMAKDMSKSFEKIEISYGDVCCRFKEGKLELKG